MIYKTTSPIDFSRISLTLKASIRTAAENIHKYFFIVFSEKIRLDVSSESSARWRFHLKRQALLSWKVKSKKLKCLLLQFLFGAVRVKKMVYENRCSSFVAVKFGISIVFQ